MKRFKKRTIALVLASVVTVVGAFGADNYKNSLMSLEFNNENSSAVQLTVLTKTNYENTITPIKKDAQTYVIMLPETNNSMSSSPQISGNVQSVDVKTLPYTTSGKGYTKITIKTYPDTQLNAVKGLYIPQNIMPENSSNSVVREDITVPAPSAQNVQQNYRTEAESIPRNTEVTIQDNVKQFEPNRRTEEQESAKQEPVINEEPPIQNQVSQPQTQENSSEVLLLILGMMLVITTSVYLYIKGKNKITEILGEQQTIDLDDEPPKNKKAEKKSEQIRKKIKTLDKMYSKPVRMPVSYMEENISSVGQPRNSQKEQPPKTEDMILDLDELFQQQTSSKQEEPVQEDDSNEDLDAFLEGFNALQEEQEAAVEHEKENNKLYNKYINSNNLKFTKQDIDRINELLNTELSDDVIKNIENYVITDPIKGSKSMPDMLEKLITTYAVDQNITFTKSDVDALRKLMSVELDNDFITDLRTNPDRTAAMAKEIVARSNKPHKVAEILTLNVKDMLPNLSEALKKQGNKRIESEVKPQVVYYSEGFDVNILSTKNSLPDLSTAMLNKGDNEYKPSEEINLVESGYEFQTLSTEGVLPDLSDVKANPENYEEKNPQKVEVDEEALLKNISNVTFKPFYDGTEDFEIINDFDTPTVEEVEDELNQFADFEVVQDDNIETESVEEDESDDFEALYDNNYYDFDVQRDDDKEGLSEMISSSDDKFTNENIKAAEPKILHQDNIIVINNVEHQVIKTTHFTDSMGCHLTKNENGYTIIGFANESLFILKQYENLSSQNMQSRATETLPDGTTRYIIKIGANKFIFNLSGENMEYVMDLC